MVYSYLPFMIFPLYASLEKMPPQLLEAAYDLGCRPVSAFWRITVPLARSGILAGSSMVFIPAMGEYLIPELLGGPTALTIGRLLWFEFFVNRDWPLSATLAILVMVALWLPMWLGKRIVGFFQQRFGP
jgi:putrescine transport system permease protein